MPRRCASTAGRCTDITRSRIASTRLEPGAPDAVGWPGVPVSPGSTEDSTSSAMITSSSRGSGCWSTVSAYVARGVRLLVSRRPLRGLLNQLTVEVVEERRSRVSKPRPCGWCGGWFRDARFAGSSTRVRPLHPVVGVVAVDHLADRRVEHEGALVEVEAARAEPQQVALAVRDEE